MDVTKDRVLAVMNGVIKEILVFIGYVIRSR